LCYFQLSTPGGGNKICFREIYIKKGGWEKKGGQREKRKKGVIVTIGGEKNLAVTLRGAGKKINGGGAM